MEKAIYHRTIKHIHYAEEMVYPEGWSFCPHTHECYHLFCVLSGTLTLLVDGTPYSCEPGDAFIVPPLTAHGMKKQANGMQKILEIMFDLEESDIKNTLKDMGIRVHLNEMSFQCLRRAAAFANSRAEHLRGRAYDYLGAALTELCTAAEPPDPFAVNAQFIDMDGFSAVTKSVIIYIDAHYKEQFTLDDMGKALGYSKSYLCTTFKKETHSTINDYLNLVRISHFTEYYSFVDDDIAYLCRQCGFASPNHFNKTFKKFLGTTPKQFKQIRYQHFNATFRDSEINARAGTIKNLRGILERANAPTAQRELLTPSGKLTTTDKQ